MKNGGGIYECLVRGMRIGDEKKRQIIYSLTAWMPNRSRASIRGRSTRSDLADSDRSARLGLLSWLVKQAEQWSVITDHNVITQVPIAIGKHPNNVDYMTCFHRHRSNNGSCKKRSGFSLLSEWKKQNSSKDESFIWSTVRRIEFLAINYQKQMNRNHDRASRFSLRMSERMQREAALW